MNLDRRNFLRALLVGSGAALAGELLPSQLGDAFAQTTSCVLPNPQNSGIKHIVVVTMENRSFDHLFGWFPNADGKQAGLSYCNAATPPTCYNTYPLAPDYTGCPHPDPDHSYTGGRIEYDSGNMDGFLHDTNNDIYCIGYYVEQDLPFYSQLARNYTTLDRYFCSILGPTFPNRLFIHAAQTDRLSNSPSPATVPTIWDRIAATGGRVTGTYYYSNVPFLGLWGSKYISISRTYSQFLSDAASGNLPNVAFVDPWYTTTDDGTGNDDHPHADIRRGDAFLAQTFQAVATGPNWKHTVFIVNFDEWGGFFEHVAPPRATAPNNVDPDLVNGKALLGFRVPTVIASPFTRGTPSSPTVIGHGTTPIVFDHTSVLKLIEWRFGLAPLTARDASTDIQNLACALNFNNVDTNVPALPQPAAPVVLPCPGGSGIIDNPWSSLLSSGLLAGWTIP